MQFELQPTVDLMLPEYAKINERLAGIEGRFLLSLNDMPAVRSIFERFAIEAVDTTYSIAKGAGPSGKRREVLISG